MTKPEPTVDDILRVIAEQADRHNTKLADAIEQRNVGVLQNLSVDAYHYVILLRGIDRDFELTPEWTRASNEIFNEHQYLRALVKEILWRESRA